MKKYMELALKLAMRWKGYTSPNPLVGAVVVKDGQIVGKGAHKKAGEPHAEVYALQDAGELASGGILYVTLEPCSHYGRTPPCTELIIKSGLKKVVVAIEDPNPLVRGRGISRLRDAGIEVEIGVCAREAKKLNEIFFKYITTRKPFVILKTAISLDGKIGTITGDSKWITNDLARKQVHHLREGVDAVLVGVKTFLTDNPRLNVRLARKSRDPGKIILSSKLDFAPAKLKKMALYQLSRDKPLILVGSEARISPKKIKEFRKLGVDLILLPDKQGKVELEQLLIKLAEKEITSLLLEGGSGVYTSFLQAGLVDKLYIFQAPQIIGDDGIGWVDSLGIKEIAEAIKLQDVEFEFYGDNLLTIGYLDNYIRKNSTWKE